MSGFPNVDNVDVYKYKNDFDYGRWQADVKLKICNVPWCGDYDNVVKFTDDAARDAYLDSLGTPSDSAVLDSMFHIKPNGEVMLPFTQEVLQSMNYLVVDLPVPTSPEQPIYGAELTRKTRYCYFITETLKGSPNGTRCIVSLDVWTTFVNDITFDYVLLERGHAPVAASPVESYIENPIGNSRYLLTPDVNTGGTPYMEARKVTRNYSAETHRACVAMYADLQGDWGAAQAPKVPAVANPFTDGAAAPRVYGMAIGDLNRFLAIVENSIPWAKQCVLGVFFAPADLLTDAGSFDFNGVRVTVHGSAERVSDFMKPAIGDFGYPEEARAFAKLYTYPYAEIRITDETGASSTVRVEDLDENGLQIADSINLIAPALKLESRLIGIAGASDTLEFHTTEGRSYTYGGAWGDYIRSWGVPVMEVSQSAAKAADWGGVYERAQAKLAADNALASALAGNATSLANTSRSVQAMLNNNAVSVATNEKCTNSTNANSVAGAIIGNTKISQDTLADVSATYSTTEIQNEIVSLTTANNNTATLARGVSSVITGAATGAMAGPAGAVAGAVMGGVTAIADAAVSIPQTNAAAAISQSSNTQMASVAIENTRAKSANATSFATNSVSLSNTYASALTSFRNDQSNTIAQNNAASATGSANATKSTADANANRSHDTAIAAIAASLNQAGVNAPRVYGASANAANLGIAPRMLCAQIVTQRESAIMDAASAFARYGYSLSREWSMEDMQVMKYFTYWKCGEVWCSGVGNAIEDAQAVIKSILINGVTVWSDPEKIGKVSIYDNFK